MTEDTKPQEEKPNGKAMVAVSAGRFPYVSKFDELFGVDRIGWRTICDVVFPNAKSIDSIYLALAYCKSRGLDVLKRPVHIVPMWNSALGQTVDTIWPGIGELRTTAARTKLYAGKDQTIYGPTVEETYGNEKVQHPEWCEVVVYKIVSGHRVAFHGPRAYWRETYAHKSRKDPAPNDMWRNRPFGQIEKCAEAGALRAAFPEELGNEYAAEEMEGKTIEGQFSQVAAPAAAEKKASVDKLAVFAKGDAEDAPPTDNQPTDEMVNRAALKAMVEKIDGAGTGKLPASTRKEADAFIVKWDADWPEGKDQLVAALAAQQERSEAA